MSQRIGPFLAGVGVVTAAYISGRVNPSPKDSRGSAQAFPKSGADMKDDMQAFIWNRAESIAEAWPSAPAPKQPLSVRASVTFST